MEEKRPFWLDTDGGDTIQFFDQVYRVKASGAQTGGLFGLVEVSTSERMGDLLPRCGPGDGRSGSGSSGGRGVGEGARRHVARPAACSVRVDSAAVSRSVTLNEPGRAAGNVGRQSGLTAR